MCRSDELLLETIRIENGVPCALAFHDARLNAARQELLGAKDMIRLADVIDVPEHARYGVFKCRIIAGRSVESIGFERYTLPAMRRLALVVCDDIAYHHKRLDRSTLETLMSMRGDADGIVIVKNGMITDTHVSNIALYDGKRWFTPATPLLAGTRRARLLDAGLLVTADIRPDDLSGFERLSLINAMIDLNVLCVSVTDVIGREIV